MINQRTDNHPPPPFFFCHSHYLLIVKNRVSHNSVVLDLLKYHSGLGGVVQCKIRSPFLKNRRVQCSCGLGKLFWFLYVSSRCKLVILGCFVGGDGLLPGFSVLLQSLICVFYNASAGWRSIPVFLECHLHIKTGVPYSHAFSWISERARVTHPGCVTTGARREAAGIMAYGIRGDQLKLITLHSRAVMHVVLLSFWNSFCNYFTSECQGRSVRVDPGTRRSFTEPTG